jgi:hypothetical protein
MVNIDLLLLLLHVKAHLVHEVALLHVGAAATVDVVPVIAVGSPEVLVARVAEVADLSRHGMWPT